MHSLCRFIVMATLCNDAVNFIKAPYFDMTTINTNSSLLIHRYSKFLLLLPHSVKYATVRNSVQSSGELTILHT
jgi:hypothetical protein